MELELICAQNGSVLISFRTALTPVLGTNHLELELTCPQNGSECGSKRLKMMVPLCRCCPLVGCMIKIVMVFHRALD